MGDESTESLVGELLLGKLEVLAVLGEGGMGAVYEVRHRLTKHHRALKVLHAGIVQDAEVVTRFLREASVAGTLRTPFVVETFDAGQLDDGSPYVLMEMLEGQTLDDAMRSDELTQSRFVEMACEACKGLAAAHEAGIVHRDLKPENIFVAKTHDGERVKLLDFGISKFSRRDDEEEARLTRTGRVLGTPLYMSPEQASGASDLDARTDIYSLGVILYEGLGGRPPFVAETLPALVIQIHTGDFEPLRSLRPGLDGELAEVVEKAMSRLPEERFQTIGQLEAALAPFTPAGRASRISLAETMGASPSPADRTPAEARELNTGPVAFPETADSDLGLLATHASDADAQPAYAMRPGPGVAHVIGAPGEEPPTPPPSHLDAPLLEAGGLSRARWLLAAVVLGLLGAVGVGLALSGSDAEPATEPEEPPPAATRAEPTEGAAAPSEPLAVPSTVPSPAPIATPAVAPEIEPEAPVEPESTRPAPAETSSRRARRVRRTRPPSPSDSPAPQGPHIDRVAPF